MRRDDASLTAKPRGFRFNANEGSRDRFILLSLAEHRFLDTDDIILLAGGRWNNGELKRRLGQLFENGYIHKPKAQWRDDWKSGSQSDIYGLGNRGADKLAELELMRRTASDYNHQNKKYTLRNLRHTHLNSKAAVRAEVAPRNHPTIRFSNERQIIAEAPAATRRRKYPVPGLQFDDLYRYQYLDKPQPADYRYFFSEIWAPSKSLRLRRALEKRRSTA